MSPFKRFVTLFLVLFLLSTLMPAALATETEAQTFTAVNETVYATTAVNVRTGPGTNYAIVDTLSTGDAVQRSGIGSDGWSKVIYDGAVAYIYSEFLSATRTIETDPEMDYTALTNQIALVNGLKQADYTKETWAVLANALEQANIALNGADQTAVDECVTALKDAAAALVKVDYSALETALAAFSTFFSGQEQSELWVGLVETAKNGEALLNSGDQAAVDDAAAELNERLAEANAFMESQAAPEIITQEVMVEVPPTDDYCNVPGHRVWPVLFFISLVLNLALVALIVIYVTRKKRNQKDDTPLVDYDISDDM